MQNTLALTVINSVCLAAFLLVPAFLLRDPGKRVSELMDWVQSGEYDRIIGGWFPTRDQQPDPKEEAGKAYDHYRERFRKSFEDAGDSLERAIDKMAEWLQGRR